MFNEFVSPYYNPLTYLAEFATGILAARLYSTYPALINNRYLIPIALVTLALSIISFLYPILEWFFHFWFSLSVGAFILLIVINLQSFKVNNLAFNTTEKLGKLTYGLYVHSGFVITFSEKIFPGMNIYLKGVIQFMALLGIAHLSYRVLEKPFLSLKKYFRYNT